MGATGTALAIIAGAQAISTVGSAYTQSRALKQQGKFESQIANQNAALAEIQAKDALLRGDQERQTYQLQVKKLLGSQRARLAAQGLDLGSGSALDVLQDTARAGAYDAMTIKNNAFREAMGYEIASTEYRTQGTLARLTAKQKSTQTILTAGMQIANIGASYYYSRQLSQIGAPQVPTTPVP